MFPAFLEAAELGKPVVKVVMASDELPLSCLQFLGWTPIYMEQLETISVISGNENLDSKTI